MRHSVWIGTVTIALLAGGRGWCGEPPCCEPPQECVLKRLAPVGGWHPYGGSLLHWWDPCWFPCDGGPDDYCPKPLPRLRWPVCPPDCKGGSNDLLHATGRPAGGH
jgi:hypothetical protein